MFSIFGCEGRGESAPAKNPLRKSASPGEIRFAWRNPLRLKLICRKSGSPDADWSDADCPDALKIDVLLSFFFQGFGAIWLQNRCFANFFMVLVPKSMFCCAFFKVLVSFGFKIDVLLSFFNVLVPKSMFCHTF